MLLRQALPACDDSIDGIVTSSKKRLSRRLLPTRYSKREDDLLDAFCYGIAIALGNREGF